MDSIGPQLKEHLPVDKLHWVDELNLGVQVGTRTSTTVDESDENLLEYLKKLRLVRQVTIQTADMDKVNAFMTLESDKKKVDRLKQLIADATKTVTTKTLYVKKTKK
jgi:hypothetical protein